MKNKKGFTLIELIAVLVILAILALIVTPLVMNIIRKARVSADKRSVDAYGRSVELAIATHLLDTGTFPTDLKNLNVEYTGKTVSCNIMQMKENGGIYLSECTVGTKAVKDSSTEDGYYHYGTRDLTNEEYIDMYGKSLEKALKEYYDINNSYPSDYKVLTLDYSGKNVICNTKINYDGTVYLTNCNVDGLNITDTNNKDGYYHYGKNEYSVGDEVIYNGMNFYVISQSSDGEKITLLKGEPLKYEEVQLYSNSTEFGTENNNGYGVMYYASNNDSRYINSYIKIVVENWSTANINSRDLIEDYTGYSARLLTLDEMVSDLGYVEGYKATTYNITADTTPLWVYNNQYSYWTMSQGNDSSTEVWAVGTSGVLGSTRVATSWTVIYGSPSRKAVRPVITISKSSI